MALAPSETLFDEITDFLAAGPSSAGILAYRPSDVLNRRLHELLDRNADDALSPAEQDELNEFLRMNHLLKMIQAKARLKLIDET